MNRRRRLTWLAVGLSILALTYTLHTQGFLARLDHGVAATRARLLAHEADSDIVIVGIDSHSLRTLSEWPWPRRHHARLLQQLARGAPASVFLDIDFSSVSNAEDDALFERALASWDGSPVLLATYWQPATADKPALIRPLPRFARHARQASVVLEPSTDGLVREMQSSWQIGGEVLRSVFAHEQALPAGTTVPIDFSILPSSFDYVAYSDLLNAEIDFTALQGKQIYVGAMAVELGDVVPVPVFRTGLPGVVVQALAAESLRAGLLRSPPQWLYFCLLAVWAALHAALFGAQTWRRNLLALGAGFMLLGVVNVYLYSQHRIDLLIVPFGALGLAIFVAATIRSLDDQTWRALAYAVGIRRRDALLKSIVDSSTDCIVCVDGEGVIRRVNPSAARLFERAARDLLGSSIADFVPDLAGGSATLSALAGCVTEHEANSAGGRCFPVELAVSRVGIDGDEPLFTAVIRDVTERQAHQRELEYQATHDSLTGLPNRTALAAYLDSVLSKTAPERRVALLMLDLCRFKEVNDTLGHEVGDDVLREVAHRFGLTLTDRAFIGRIGGDEFTVVLPAVSNTIVIDDISQKLVETLKAPIHAQGVAIDVGLSIGIALWPDHAGDAPELLRHADVAMYVAKRQGSAYEYYDPEHDQHTVRRLSMLSELRGAISRNEINLFYQPQVNLQTGRSESAEALLRWQHGVLGNVSPAEFVPLAEATDLIQPLTDWTLRRALSDLQEWRKRGLELRVAVNVSARVLQDAGFPGRLKQLLEIYAVESALLELEITESAMMIDPDRAQRIVRDLLALGVTISIDDYGTGFSSLGYLRDLHVHALKLDQSFVIDLEKHEQNRVIVESTVRMAHALGLQVVAEGVETERESEYLKSIGYDFGQGYWFARPMPAAECFDWVAGFNAESLRRYA